MSRFLFPAIFIFSLFITSCGTTFNASKPDKRTKKETSYKAGQKIEEGIASWYGPNFHGKLTANGEVYDMQSLTAAHRTLPFNSIVRVHNIDNDKSVEVRINDRGPYAKNRIIDLSKKAAQRLDMLGPGTANVELILVDGKIDNTRVTDLKTPTYTIQLASYREKNQAFTHSQKIKGSRVEKVKLDNRTVYRVYFGTYINKDQARTKQRELKKRGYLGYVKQIQN